MTTEKQLTIRIHIDVPTEVIAGVLDRLETLYLACGGGGFSVEIQDEDKPEEVLA